MGSTSVIQEARLQVVCEADIARGRYVLYWMVRSQRAVCNHALEYAIQQANALDQPLVVLFVIADNDAGATRRQLQFQVEGLRETKAAILRRGVMMTVRVGSPEREAMRLTSDASMVVLDRSYVNPQRAWAAEVASQLDRRAVCVETDAVVPVRAASDHREFAARTIRSKLQERHGKFLVDLRTTSIKHDSTHLTLPGEDLAEIESVVRRAQPPHDVPPVSGLFSGGFAAAQTQLRKFIDDGLSRYDTNRNRPETSDISRLSMYLHFGQISPLAVALKIQNAATGNAADRDAYLEELLIRRELSMNFVEFTADYDCYRCLPTWAQETLDAHRDDAREPRYTRRELEEAATEDPYWNAAMRQMRDTGFMHNYMRMYWGKKILEWSGTPEHAHRVTLELNNRYFLDGRDANSFANVAWIFGNHDRAFAERPIYGKVRYLSQSGLRRKADADAYIDKVDRIIEAS